MSDLIEISEELLPFHRHSLLFPNLLAIMEVDENIAYNRKHDIPSISSNSQGRGAKKGIILDMHAKLWNFAAKPGSSLMTQRSGDFGHPQTHSTGTSTKPKYVQS